MARNPLDAALTRLLLEAGSAIIRASDEQTLFDRVCRLLVDHCGFRLAWLGLTEPAGDRLSEAAVCGRDSIDVEGFRALALSGEGRRAAVRRVRAGEPWAVADGKDRPTEDAEWPWSTLAGALGVGSVALLPIASDRLVHGVIVVASDNPGYFVADRLSRLGRLAGDVASKLDWLGRRAGNRACEEALHRAHARLGAFWDHAPHAILVVSSLGFETNATFAAIFGLGEARNPRLRDLRRLLASELISDICTPERHRGSRAGTVRNRRRAHRRHTLSPPGPGQLD